METNKKVIKAIENTKESVYRIAQDCEALASCLEELKRCFEYYDNEIPTNIIKMAQKIASFDSSILLNKELGVPVARAFNRVFNKKIMYYDYIKDILLLDAGETIIGTDFYDQYVDKLAEIIGGDISFRILSTRDIPEHAIRINLNDETSSTDDVLSRRLGMPVTNGR